LITAFIISSIQALDRNITSEQTVIRTDCDYKLSELIVNYLCGGHSELGTPPIYFLVVLSIAKWTKESIG